MSLVVKIAAAAATDDDDDDDTGGDDVNQLCEAGEEEFLEIMALVGMASKPLHVRRLQKALLEWIVEPGTMHSYTCQRCVTVYKSTLWEPNPSQSYGTSPAAWDHTVLSATRHL